MTFVFFHGQPNHLALRILSDNSVTHLAGLGYIEGGGRCCTRRSVYWESLHTVVNLYTLSFGRRGGLGSFFDSERQLASADWRSFSYFSSSFSRKCWHKKKMVASTERENDILIRVVLD
jgi:hypothetical protein